MTTKRRLAYTALLLNCLIWGLALPIVKPALSHLTPIQFLYFRYLLAAPLSLILLPFIRLPKISLATLGKITLLEFIGTPILLAILYTGLAKTTGLEASLLGATSPLFTILGGIWFLKEHQTRREWQGLALAMIGTLLLTLEPLFLGQTLTISSLSGNFLIILQNLIWAGYLIVAKRLYRSLPKLFVTAFSYWLGLFCFAGYLLTTRSLPPLSTLWLYDFQLLFPVLYMAILGSIVALALYLYGQDKIEASEASIFTYLQGVIAIPAAFFLLGEKPTLLTLLAIIIISYGVLRAELRKK
ncbi:MAG: DMT family transporter [bacterium]